MTTHIDEAVDQVLSSGLASASEDDIIRQLDAELQQQAQARALVLSGTEPEPWVLGGQEGGGFGTMAQRFLNFYADALHREICDAQQLRLKDTYRDLLGGKDLAGQAKALAPVVLAAFGVSASLVAPATVAAIVALWLLRTGLEQWCAVPRAAVAESGAAPPVTLPVGTDPAPLPSAQAIEPGVAEPPDPAANDEQGQEDGR